MQAQKLLLIVLVTGLLILQLSPTVLARPRDSRSTGNSNSGITGDSITEDTDTDTEDNTEDSRSEESSTDIVRRLLPALNLLIDQLNHVIEHGTLPSSPAALSN